METSDPSNVETEKTGSWDISDQIPMHLDDDEFRNINQMVNEDSPNEMLEVYPEELGVQSTEHRATEAERLLPPCTLNLAEYLQENEILCISPFEMHIELNDVFKQLVEGGIVDEHTPRVPSVTEAESTRLHEKENTASNENRVDPTLDPDTGNATESHSAAGELLPALNLETSTMELGLDALQTTGTRMQPETEQQLCSTPGVLNNGIHQTSRIDIDVPSNSLKFRCKVKSLLCKKSFRRRFNPIARPKFSSCQMSSQATSRPLIPDSRARLADDNSQLEIPQSVRPMINVSPPPPSSTIFLNGQVPSTTTPIENIADNDPSSFLTQKSAEEPATNGDNQQQQQSETSLVPATAIHWYQLETIPDDNLTRNARIVKLPWPEELSLRPTRLLLPVDFEASSLQHPLSYIRIIITTTGPQWTLSTYERVEGSSENSYYIMITFPEGVSPTEIWIVPGHFIPVILQAPIEPSVHEPSSSTETKRGDDDEPDSQTQN